MMNQVEAVKNYLAMFGTGISSKKMVSQVYKDMGRMGVNVTIEGETSIGVDGKRYQLIRQRSKGSWGLKEW